MRQPACIPFLFFVMLAVSAGACGGGSTPGSSATAAPGTTIEVTVGNYPLAEFASAVGGDQVTITNLASPGVEPHDVELTAKQVGAISTADLVVAIPGYQPALDDAIEAVGAGDRVLDATAGVTLIDRSGSKDPHIWLDPVRAKIVVSALAARLAQITPGVKATFDANAAAYNRKLDALSGEYDAGLSECARRDFVTAHAAFGYLAEHYQLQQTPIAGLSPDEEPSPQQIEEIVQFAREHAVTVIFFEELILPELSETIASEVGAKTLVLSPIEARTEEQEAAGKDLFAIAADNLANLRTALDCR